MTLETLTQLFAWMTAINLGLLIAATLPTMLARNRATAFHATLFDLDQADIRLTFYRFLGQYKLGIILFNLVPYIALRIVQ